MRAVLCPVSYSTAAALESGERRSEIDTYLVSLLQSLVRYDCDLLWFEAHRETVAVSRQNETEVSSVTDRPCDVTQPLEAIGEGGSKLA